MASNLKRTRPWEWRSFVVGTVAQRGMGRTCVGGSGALWVAQTASVASSSPTAHLNAGDHVQHIYSNTLRHAKRSALTAVNGPVCYSDIIDHFCALYIRY